MRRAFSLSALLAAMASACGGSIRQSEITGMVDEVWENSTGHTIQYTGSAGVLYVCEEPAGQPKTCASAKGEVVDEAEISASYHPRLCAASYILVVEGQPTPRYVALRCWQ
jgi:hypothetical protein